MSDVYAYWRAKGKGEADQSVLHKVMVPTIYPKVSNDNPQPGAWRVKLVKGGSDVPVRIWLTDDDGKVINAWRDGLLLAGNINGETVTVEKIERHWTFMRHCSKADMDHYNAHKRWPGEIEAAPPKSNGSAGIGDNSGVAQDVPFPEEVATAVKSALAWLAKTPIKTKADADMAKNYHGRMRELWGRADKERKAEKEPHLVAGQAVDEKFRPLLKDTEDAGKKLNAAYLAWGAVEDERLRKEAAEAARIENEKRIAAYQAEQKKAVEAATVSGKDPLAATLDSLKTVPIPEMVKPEAVKVELGGSTGRKATIKQVQVPVIEDYAKVLEHCAESPEVMAAVEKVAFAKVKAGLTVPGVGFKTDYK